MSDPFGQQSPQVYTDPTTGRRYALNPRTGQSYWLDEVPPPPQASEQSTAVFPAQTSAFPTQASPAWASQQPPGDVSGPEPAMWPSPAQPQGGWPPIHSAPAKRSRRRTALIVVGALFAGFIVIGIIGNIVNPPKNQNTAATTTLPATPGKTSASPAPKATTAGQSPMPSPKPSLKPSTSKPVPAPVDPAVADAQGWISRRGNATHAVQVGVQSVQAGILLLRQQDNLSAADVASFSQLAQQAHDFIINAAMDMNGDDGGPNGDAKQEAFQAAWQLQDSMNTLVVWLDNQKPSELAKFMQNYQEGVAAWNDAMTKLYGKAGMKPPTV